MLSPQHLALAQSLPHSNASTPTPSLLTPPVSGTPNMSPPPRHEADDYMNVHVHDSHDHKRKQFRNNMRKHYKNTTEVDGGPVQTWPATFPSAVAVDGPDSAAVNALRSFGTNPTAPKVSFAAKPSHKTSKKVEEPSRRSSAHSKTLAYWNTNRPTFKDGQNFAQTLGTPATITLRKASNAPDLLAFYSAQTFEKRPMLTDLPSPAEAPRGKQPTFTCEMESQCLRRGSKSVAQFSDMSNARRCSTPAEAAITFADVHVAPGSFAVGPKSGKQSLELTDFSRRISTIQFLSRNSVHEVIWQEDETTSDGSQTASSKASQQAGHSFRSTPSPESEGSLTQEPAEAAVPMVPDSLSMFTRMPDSLFQWSWGASSVSAQGTHRAVNSKGDPGVGSGIGASSRKRVSSRHISNMVRVFDQA
ncbi:MAG: hypothetical protein ASARMPRED_006971 [Alectoria sarmentosa]|nr:MAG: hypothetical protein ASARMPRED_006971 [Alectoria sarmentosa]